MGAVLVLYSGGGDSRAYRGVIRSPEAPLDISLKCARVFLVSAAMTTLVFIIALAIPRTSSNAARA